MRNNKGQFIKGSVPWHKGLKNAWKNSKETIRKMSLAKKGKTPKNIEEFRKKGSLACIGKEPWNKGKIGIMPPPWNKGLRGYNCGDKSPSWKGGITPINKKIRNSVEYKLWRTAVFERDGYTCIWCGRKKEVAGKLNADHIKPFAYYPELRFAIDNGRTLCVGCHKTTDTYLWKGKKYEN